MRFDGQQDGVTIITANIPRQSNTIRADVGQTAFKAPDKSLGRSDLSRRGLWPPI